MWYSVVGKWTRLCVHIPRGDGRWRCYDGFATSGGSGAGVAGCVFWSLTYTYTQFDAFIAFGSFSHSALGGAARMAYRLMRIHL